MIVPLNACFILGKRRGTPLALNPPEKRRVVKKHKDQHILTTPLRLPPKS